MSVDPVFVELKGSIGDLKAKLGEAKSELTGLSKHGATEMDKLAAVGKGAVLGLGAAFVTLGALGIKAAADEQAATASLRQAVENTGASWKDYSERVDKAEAAGRKLGFTDDETARSMARLTQATHNPTEAIKDQALAMDIARGRNSSLAEATDLLAKVETGHVALLGRLGIKTTDATGATISQDEAMKRLAATFGGSASAYAQTFTGKIAALKAQGDQLEETLGNALIPGVLKVGSAALATAGFFERNKVAAYALGGTIAGVLVPAMGAYALAQARAISATTIGLADEAAGAFFTLGASLIGVDEAAVAAEGGMSAVVATTAAGVAPFVAIGAAIAALTIADQHQTDAANKMADQFVKTHTTLQSQVDGLNEMSAASAVSQIRIRGLIEHTGLLGAVVAKHLPEFINFNGQQREQARAVEIAKDKIKDQAKATHDMGVEMDKAAQDEGFADAATKKLSETVDKMAGSLTGLLSATEAEKNASTGVTAAEQRLAETRAKVNKLTEEGTVDARAVADATKAHDRAVQSVTEALRRQTDAQNTLNDLLHPSARSQDEAAIAATKAADAVTRAQLRAKDAAANLAKVRADGSSTSADAITAELDLRDANEAVTEAEYAQQDADQKVTDLMPGNIASTDAYRSAKDQLDDATRQVADATEAERTAGDKLRDAQAADPAKVAELAAAKRDEKTAQDDLTTAKANATKTAYEHATALAAEADQLRQHPELVGQLVDKLNALDALDPAAAPYVKALMDLLGNVGNAYGGAVSVNGLPGGFQFAAGGDPPVGRDVLVGEHGPEIARFRYPATIYPNGSSPPGGAGSTITIMPGAIVVNEAVSGARTSREVVEQIAEYDSRNRR